MTDRLPRLLLRAALPAAAFLALALWVSCGARAQGIQQPDFSVLAEELMPAVVNIATTAPVPTQAPSFPPGSPFEEFFRDFFENHPGTPQRAPRARPRGMGSGFVIDPDGLIVTNNHVVEDADDITVILSDGSSLAAEVVGRDPKTDIALLRVDPDGPLAAVDWGDSDGARVGNWVFAIGNPFGLVNSLTVGVISAIARDIGAGPFDEFIQTDAAINRGNSGGPLFNLDGEVIGVNTAIYSPSGGSVGIGFAVPSSLAKSVVFQLREYGRTRRGWLGVRIQTVTEDLAESLSLGEAEGALVSEVIAGSPAEDGGILPGDVLLTFDGRPVPDMRNLPRMVAETAIGRVVGVGVWRGGAMLSLEVVLGELEEEGVVQAAVDPEPDVQTVGALGLSLANLTREFRARYAIADGVRGAVVVEVDPDSDAAAKGMRPGDVVVEIGQASVDSPRDVAEGVARVEGAGRNSVLLLVNRDGNSLFIALRTADS